MVDADNVLFWITGLLVSCFSCIIICRDPASLSKHSPWDDVLGLRPPKIPAQDGLLDLAVLVLWKGTGVAPHKETQGLRSAQVALKGSVTALIIGQDIGLMVGLHGDLETMQFPCPIHHIHQHVQKLNKHIHHSCGSVTWRSQPLDLLSTCFFSAKHDVFHQTLHCMLFNTKEKDTYNIV